MEKVVFIAGGVWQKPFVQYLKNKRHYVAVVNPVPTGTTALADLHIRADVNDVDTIGKYIEELKPRFVTSDQSDISTYTVARLSERYGLPGNSVEIVEKLTDKYLIYQFAKSLGINVPISILADNAQAVRSFAERIGFPVIIKPTDSTNSRGFRKFEKVEDITEETFANTRSFSKSRRVIAQEFISGHMIAMDGVCSGGKHRTLATSIKKEYFKPGITVGCSYPADVPSDLLSRLHELNDLYVESVPMRFGLTHSEWIVNENGYWFIEIGGRGGGAGITDKIVPWVSGICVYDILYASLMRETVDVKTLKPLSRSALLKYYRDVDVPLCDEEKAAQIRQLPGVADFQYNFIGKQYVRDNNDIRHTMAIYLGETPEDIESVKKSVCDYI